jgi:formyl-CoA transferase
MTGYGEVGPEANRPGYDINAWWARSGLVDIVRGAGPLPNGYPAGMGDHLCAMSLFGAIMLALYRRERTGRGAKVTSSLMANGAWSNGVAIQAALCGATFYERRPRERAHNALLNLYQSRDGRWFNLTLLREDKDWPNLARAVGRPELIADPRFATRQARYANSAALVQILDEAFATRDWSDWVRILAEHRVPCGAVHRADEAREDRQMAEIGALVPLEDAGVPGLRTVSSPIQIAGQPKVPPRRAPELGEHTEEVLRGLGYHDAALKRLRTAGVIG